MNAPGRAPTAAAWTLTLLVAGTTAAGVYHVPIMVSDSLEVILNMDATDSVRTAFLDALRSSETMLRPLRQAQTKALLDFAEAQDGRYHLAFRGYHALGAAFLVLLFAAVVRPRTWIDAASLAFALTVLTGHHTVAGMLREAYPINHFLLIGLYALATLALAQSRGGVLADVAAVACLALASLTLESGLLVWVVAVAGSIAGLRGLSRGAIAVMTVLVCGYLAFRFGYLDMSAADLGDRTTGFGVRSLSTEQQVEVFGDNPLPLYAYTVVSSLVTVLLSQPSAGVWTAIAAWQDDQFAPVYVIEIVTSIAATALCVWYLAGRSPGGQRRRWREPVPFIALSVLAASAGVSYAYAKDEIVSTAGAFYAVVVFHAARELIGRLAISRSDWRAVPVALALLVFSAGWAVRSLGLHYELMHGGYDARTEWALSTPPVKDWNARTESAAALAARIRDHELQRGGLNPHLLPGWAMALWGED